MAIASSPAETTDRRARRREQTIEEALDHAEEIMAQHGVGALTVSEVARRMGVKSPSLYKYFPSLHDVYDRLFARGLAGADAAVQRAVTGPEPGLARIREGVRAVVAWAVDHPALAQLLYWRTVPGFEPSPETFATSVRGMDELRTELSEAIRRRQLHPAAASEDGVRMMTVVMSGLISQQMANEPGVRYARGSFSRLADAALDMFVAHYDPQGGSHADAGP